MYKTLECRTGSNQARDLKIDFDELKKFFTAIRPELSRQVRQPHHIIHLPCFEDNGVE